MNHRDFFSLIKKGLPCMSYVVHGEEEYVKEQAIRALINTIEPDLRPFNVTELSKPSPQELAETCDTLPLFSDKRIVLCYELADGADAAKYKSCFEEHAPETALLFVFKGKLAANSAMLKYAKKSDTEVLFDPLTPADCAKWCVKHCTEEGVVLRPDTAQMLVRVVGTNMANLVSETDKLIDFAGKGGEVTSEAISACARTSLDVRVFDMLDMFTYGKPGDGVIALHALFDEGSDPMSIAAFLSGRFKIMLEARRGIDAGKRKNEVASQMEGNRYANEKAYDAARRFTSDELLKLISDISDTAFMKISGKMKEDKYLELVLLKHEWRQFPV